MTSIREWEAFLNRLKALVKSEEEWLDYLYQKRIDILNGRKTKLFGLKLDYYGHVKEDIETMIETSEDHLKHYRRRVGEYTLYIKNMKEE